MAIELITNRSFNSSKYRHYINESNSVLHCHHYAALYTQLADDAGELCDGPVILYETAAESFYPILKEYFEKNNIDELDERIKIIEQYWAFSGMGQLMITNSSVEGGEAEMPFSHVDSGWIKKWGNRDEAVNFITLGYLAAAFAAIHNLPSNSFEATETQSIVAGAEKSQFKITKNRKG